MREGLTPGWLHAARELPASPEAQRRYGAVLAVFKGLDHTSERQEGVASTVRLLQLLIKDVTLVEALHEVACMPTPFLESGP